MKIEYTSLDRVSDYWEAVDGVARERKYLLFTKAPPIEGTEAFVKEIIEKNWTQFMAIESDRVVGWCDIIPYSYEGCEHTGHLGMAVVSSHRRKGIGEELLRRAIKDSQEKGLERIELEVFSTNEGAIALYTKLGFQTEGTKRKARRIDGIEHDFIIMALHNPKAEPVATGQSR
ncbi:MAG: GNAT family N-acetyltransferase [Verrucomicrobiota bacterium]